MQNLILSAYLQNLDSQILNEHVQAPYNFTSSRNQETDIGKSVLRITSYFAFDKDILNRAR